MSMAFNKTMKRLVLNTSILIFVMMIMIMSGCATDPGRIRMEHIAKGRQYLAGGQYPEARIEFRTALQADGRKDLKLVEAHLGLGEAALGMGYFQEAAESYYEVMRIAPDNLEARIRAGSLLLKYPNEAGIKEAERLANDVILKKPEYVDGHLLSANALIARREWEGAKVAIDRAIQLDPGRIDGRISLARLYTERAASDQKNAESLRNQAESTYKQIIETHPESAPAHLAYGDYLFALNRHDEAEKQLIAATTLDTKDRLTLSALFRYYESRKRYQDAEKVLTGLIALDQNKVAGRAQMIDLHARAGLADQAMAEYRQLLAERPEFLRGYSRLAELLLDAGDLPGAAAQIEAALKRSPQDTDGLLLRGRIKIINGQYREALNDLEQVLRFEPLMPEALYAAADAHLQNNDASQARLLVNRLLANSPKNPMGMLMLVRIQLSETRTGDAERTATKALENLKGLKNDYPSQIAGRVSFESLPDWESRTLVTRAVCRINLRDYAGAQKDVEDALSIDPSSAEARINLAVIHMVRGRLDDAAREAGKALELAPGNIGALATINDVAIRQGRFREALARMDSLLATQGDRPQILEQKARIFIAQKDTASAETTLRRLVEKHPDYINAYFALSDLYQISQNRTDRAIGELNEIIRLKPGNITQIAQAHLMIALLEESRGNLDAAVRNYEASIGYEKRSAGAAIAFNNLAWLYADKGKGNLDQATDYARSAIAITPEASFYDTLGYAYLKKGQFDMAIDQFKKAIERRPQNQTYRGHLAQAEGRRKN